VASVVLQIQQAARLFDRMLDPIVAELGVSLSDLPVLVMAVQRGGASITWLRDSFGYPASTISLAVDRLERQGYVRRRRDLPDGRIVVVYATRPGRVAAQVAQARIAEIERRLGVRAGARALLACLQVLDAARAVRLPESMMEVSLPRRSRSRR
jgi:DNA-binding MarR family transcriptional regulator